MTLEYEKLLQQVSTMVDAALSRQRKLTEQKVDIVDRFETYASDRETINHCLELARQKTGNKLYAAAPHPAYEAEPLNVGVPLPSCPDTAVILGADGSQILPDRHAPFLYYLINIGLITYYHGTARAPTIETRPTLKFPDDNLDADESEFMPARVNIVRDLGEMDTLSEVACTLGEQAAEPVLAILDQRLLYWPIGENNPGQGQRAVQAWIQGLQNVEAHYRRHGRPYLAGFISNPGTSAVVNMLRTLDIDKMDPDTGLSLVDTDQLQRRSAGLIDVTLFAEALQPGERSTIFTNISEINTQFGKRGQEICFFYLNTARSGTHISRVDIPRWLADDTAAVDAVHALVVDQCKFEYPYVLTRADEIAVILREDREYFESMIALRMGPEYALQRQSPKAQGKGVTRSGPARYE